MTWIVIVSIVVASAIKILITCLPTPVVKWLLNKFATHPELNPEQVTIEIDGKKLDGENKDRVINDFNKGTLLKSYYVHPGNQELYLHPENYETPIIIEAKIGGKIVKLFVYCHKDRIDVVKLYKKKVTAYSILSDNLQQLYI